MKYHFYRFYISFYFILFYYVDMMFVEWLDMDMIDDDADMFVFIILMFSNMTLISVLSIWYHFKRRGRVDLI